MAIPGTGASKPASKSPVMTDPCPACGLVDQVQHVPAAFHGGHSFYRGQGPMVAIPAGDSVLYTRSEVSGVSVTAVARLLDPFPVRRRTGGFVASAILFSLVGLLFMLLPQSALDDPPPGGAGSTAIAFAVLSIPAVCVFVSAGVLGWLAVKRVKANKRQRRGIPAAQALWGHGRFCHRCGGIFFATGTPGDVPAGQLVPPARFRALVAAAGGYDR